MNTDNNERLRELVEQSGLSHHVALTVFNRGLGAAPLSATAWSALLLPAHTGRQQPVSDELLAHAQAQFANLPTKT